MSTFDLAFEYMLPHECKGDEITNNLHDSGGLTKYGISLRFLRSIPIDRLKNYNIFSHAADELIALTLDDAKLLYKAEFWDHAPFQFIKNQDNCNYIFDMAVNMGIAPAIKCAQRACWSVMKKRAIIDDDGIMGDQTIAVINTCGIYLLPAMRSERAGYYKLIVEHNASQKDNLNGWLNRAYGG
jgi:lysozyme family protein